MPAPKENKFAIGNSGREKLFESSDDLQKKIDEYFYECDNRVVQVYSKSSQELVDMKKPIPYTIEGLCCVLSCERQTLLNYEKQEGYEEFFDTIKNAKARIQRNKVERGLDGESPSTFAIFDLVNNSDYKNTNSTELTGKDGAPLNTQPTIIFKKFKNDE